MAVPVRVYTRPAGGGNFAINELALTMYELPPVESHYWRDRDAFTVSEVDISSDPPTVHLEHDPEWENQIRAALPDEYWLDGGRGSTDGLWHFSVVRDGVDRPIGFFLGESLDDTIAEAVAAAHRHNTEP